MLEQKLQQGIYWEDAMMHAPVQLIISIQQFASKTAVELLAVLELTALRVFASKTLAAALLQLALKTGFAQIIRQHARAMDLRQEHVQIEMAAEQLKTSLGNQ